MQKTLHCASLHHQVLDYSNASTYMLVTTSMADEELHDDFDDHPSLSASPEGSASAHQEPLLRSALSTSCLSLKRRKEESPQHEGAPEDTARLMLPTNSPQRQSHPPSPAVYPKSNAELSNKDFSRMLKESVAAAARAPAAASNHNCALPAR